MELAYQREVIILRANEKRRWGANEAVKEQFSIEASEELSWNDLIGGSDSLAPSRRWMVPQPFFIIDLPHRIESEELTRSE